MVRIKDVRIMDDDGEALDLYFLHVLRKEPVEGPGDYRTYRLMDGSVADLDRNIVGLEEGSHKVMVNNSETLDTEMCKAGSHTMEVKEGQEVVFPFDAVCSFQTPVLLQDPDGSPVTTGFAHMAPVDDEEPEFDHHRIQGGKLVDDSGSPLEIDLDEYYLVITSTPVTDDAMKGYRHHRVGVPVGVKITVEGSMVDERVDDSPRDVPSPQPTSSPATSPQQGPAPSPRTPSTPSTTPAAPPAAPSVAPATPPTATPPSTSDDGESVKVSADALASLQERIKGLKDEMRSIDEKRQAALQDALKRNRDEVEAVQKDFITRTDDKVKEYLRERSSAVDKQLADARDESLGFIEETVNKLKSEDIPSIVAPIVAGELEEIIKEFEESIIDEMEERLGTQIDDLRARTETSMNEKISAYDEQVKAIDERQKEALEEAMAESKRDLEYAMTENRQELDTRFDGLRTEITGTLEESVKGVEETMKGVEASMDTLREGKEQLDAELNEFKSEVMEKIVPGLDEILGELQNQLTSALDETSEQMEESLATQSEKRAELETRLTELRTEVMEGVVPGIDQRIETFRTEISGSLEDTIRRLDETLDAAAQDRAGMDTRFNEFRSDMLDRVIPEMDGRLDSFRTELTGSVDGQVERIDAQVERIDGEIDSLGQARDGLRTDLTALDVEMKESVVPRMEERMNALREDLTGILEERVRAIDGSLSTLGEARIEHDGRFQETNTRLDEFNARVMDEVVPAIEQSIDTLRFDLTAALEEEVQRLNGSLNTLGEGSTELDGRVTELKDEVARNLDTELQTVRDTFANIEGSLGALREGSGEHSTRLSSLEKEVLEDLTPRMEERLSALKDDMTRIMEERIDKAVADLGASEDGKVDMESLLPAMISSRIAETTPELEERILTRLREGREKDDLFDLPVVVEVDLSDPDIGDDTIVVRSTDGEVRKTLKILEGKDLGDGTVEVTIAGIPRDKRYDVIWDFGRDTVGGKRDIKLAANYSHSRGGV